MPDLKGIIAVTVNGHALTLGDVVRSHKITGQWTFLEDTAMDYLLSREAERYGIKIGSEQLQRAVDEFRQSFGLESADVTMAWLEARKMTVNDLADRLEAELIEEELKRVLTEGEEQRYFDNDREQFECVVYGRAIFGEVEPAQAFRDAVSGAGLDFYVRAQTDRVATAVPYPICAYRRDLPKEVAAEVFSASAGQIIGPLSVEDQFWIVRVEDFPAAGLTEETKTKIRDRLYSDWKAHLLRTASVELNLLKTL